LEEKTRRAARAARNGEKFVYLWATQPGFLELMDNLSKEHRRKNMTNIRSKNNRSTERKLRSSLVGAGIFEFKLNDTSLPGRPDFSFPNVCLAVFVDGCFWRGCPECYVRLK
jgi:DNA mismatch endonuclease (patch repair protein)